MNVIIANKYKDALSSLNIDVIKRMDGEFDVNTITDTFANFYFNRMIVDITAIKDCFNIAVIQKLSANLDASKIVLFLGDDPRITNSYLSKVISLGIYNFTRDLSGVTYLMENPNSYRDVAQYHDLAMDDERKLNEAKNNPFGNVNAVFGSSQNSSYNQNSNYYGGAGSYSGTNYNIDSGSTFIIGFKDLTPDAGSTTLVYMLKKQLKNRKVLAVEVNSNDFSYFNDSELLSTSANQLPQLKSRFMQFDIVLIDINNSSVDLDGTCNEVIYLLEPSTIKLNKLMRRDRQALEKIKDKKIVLNKSLLTMSDLKEFEYEAKVKMFYNIPPLDERKDSQMVLDSFLAKLGLSTTETNNSGGSLFDIFKRQS